MNRLTRLLLVVLLFVSTSGIHAQSLTVNTTGALADTSAMLDISTTAKGVLIPRMTAAQRNSIFLPATGLLVYQTDTPAGFYYNSGTALSPAWSLMLSGNGGAIAGTLTTAIQPNITSLGTLANLTVTGAVTAGSIRTGSLTATGNVSVQGNLAVAGSLALSSLNLSGGLTTTGDAALLGNLSLSGVVTGLRLNVRHFTPDYINNSLLQVDDTDDVIIIAGVSTVILPQASVANKGKVIHITTSVNDGTFAYNAFEYGGVPPESNIYYPSVVGGQIRIYLGIGSALHVSSTIVSDGVRWYEIAGSSDAQNY
jgi:hypothetical protein